MSNESLSGLKEEAKFCPYCGEKLEYEDTSCPNCEKQITDMQITRVVERPLSLTVIAAICFLGGFNNVFTFISVMIFGPSAWTHLTLVMLLGPTVWASLRLAQGIIYISTAFGLWTGKRWSYYLAFIAVGLGVILGTLTVVSAPQGSMVSFNFVPFIWALIVYYYLGKPHAKEYLGIIKGIPLLKDGRMFCPQCGTKNEEGATVCSICGVSLVLEKKESAPLKLEREVPEKKRKWKIVAGALIAVAVFAAVGYFLLDEDLTLEDTEDFTLTDLRGGLTLTDIVFCTSEPSARSYDEKPDATYRRGEKVWMYLECSGFECEEKNNEFMVSLKVKLEVFDSQGTCIAEMIEPVETSEKVEPPYVWLNFWIDTHRLKEGEYTVQITVIDTVSGKDATIEGSFIIGGW